MDIERITHNQIKCNKNKQTNKQNKQTKQTNKQTKQTNKTNKQNKQTNKTNKTYKTNKQIENVAIIQEAFVKIIITIIKEG